MRGDTFSIPKDAPLPTFTPYPAGTRVTIPSLQTSMQKIEEFERGVLALKKAAGPDYAAFLQRVLNEVYVAKNAGTEFAARNYEVLREKYFVQLQELAQALEGKPTGSPQYPKIPSLPRPSFPMPSDPSVAFDQPSVNLPTTPTTASKFDLSNGFTSPSLQFLYQSPADQAFIKQVTSSREPSVELTTPSPDRVSAFLTPDQILALVGSMFEGYGEIKKAQLTAQIQAQQMQGRPVQAPASMIRQAKQSTTPWGLVAVVAVGLVGLGLLLSSGSKKKAEVLPATVPVTVA
jgi:hypothetical protein